ITGGELKAPKETRPEEAERREPTFREMEIRATYSETIAYIYPREIDEVESKHAPNTYETRVPDIRKPFGEQADYPGKYRPHKIKVRIPSGTRFGTQGKKTTITFIASVGNGVLYKKYLIPIGRPAIFSATADSFVIILWNLTEKTHGDRRARQTLLELLNTAE
ncbi:MAG: hypothetical protein J7L69_00630, partial [Desulfobulbaceae bacterium]|nr:hypothetical protein [Desulfobulbaceae bacterium]